MELRRKPELLAPAGDERTLAAALLSGADAVYLGLGNFNARRNAENFTLESLAAACDKAHLAGRRIYLTANTLVLDEELDDALALVVSAWEAGIDAVIVQDLGLMRRISSEHPQIEIHASTQMNILNAAGIEMAARLGATRVTLARECSLPEIAELARLGVDLEVFAHGALCICHSGQCLMSSLIGRRSANRGLCAQPCRLPWELVDAGTGDACALEADGAGEHLLSPKDLCTIDLLPQLIEAGVASLKIEGRMKSAEYVSAVTGVYRTALDRAFSDPEGYEATREEKAVLEEAFSRGFTTGYLEHHRGNEMMSYRRPNNRGVLVGRIVDVADGRVAISTTRPLHAGDVVEFWTGRGHETQTVETLVTPSGEDVSSCGAHERVYVRTQARVGMGDRVFRVRSAVLSAGTERMIEGFSGVPAKLDFEVRVMLGQPLRITVTDERGHSGSAEGAPCEPARTKAVTRDQVVEHVGRLGGTPYEASSWDISLDEGVGLAFSALHHVRQDAIADYEKRLLSAWHARRADGSAPDDAASDDPAPGASAADGPVPETSASKGFASGTAAPQGASSGKLELAAVVTSSDAARAARAAGADLIYASTFDLMGSPDTFADAAILPTVVHDGELEGHLAVAGRVSSAVTDSAAFLGMLSERLGEGGTVEAGPRTNVLNAKTAAVLSLFGATRLWLTPELSLAQIASLSAETSLPLTLTVSGAQELMVTEHCELMALGPCGQHCESCPRRAMRLELRDRKGYRFPVRTDGAGRGHVYNSVELDLASAIPDLARAGVGRFVVDGTLLDVGQVASAVGRIHDALSALQTGGHPLPRREGTTSGHLFRGVL